MAVFSQQILWGLGAVLVASEAPRKADIEVVLAGDAGGNRVLKACELLQEGYAPRILMSGADTYYGTRESLLAINLAVSRGCPREVFIPSNEPAFSTLEEATHIIPALRKMGVHSVLVVTSPSHTARARRIYRRLAPDLEIHTVAARDPHWNGGYWWKIRQGRKTWLLEMTKYLTDFLRL